MLTLLGANTGALVAGATRPPALQDVAPQESAGPPAVPVKPTPLTQSPPVQRKKRPAAAPTPPVVEAAPVRPKPAAAAPELPAVPVDPKLAPFSGLSTWIDLYDVELTAIQQVDVAAAGGVQTVFVQSGKFDSKPIAHPRRLATIIERSHDYGMQVMVWYVPDFVDQQRDFKRSVQAMAFTTPRGDRADAFGLDIEVEDLPNTDKRTTRLLALSKSLRAWAGKAYPMAAIVLPPLQLDLRPEWWPNFPYAELASYYDVFVPMSYSSFRGTDARTTFRWNHDNVVEMRRRAGDPTLPVHLAGGIADRLPQVGQFIRAAQRSKVIGAGLYDLQTTHPDAWAILRRLRVDAKAGR